MAVNSADGSPKVEKPSPSPRSAKLTKISEDELREVARKLANQPVPDSDTGAWGILTAVSKLSRKRVQGVHVILTADEHAFGRCVEDTCYRIEPPSVSSKHCLIFKEKKVANGDPIPSQSSVFLKDTSTNGTFLNWEKLRGKAKKLQHGDIISFSFPPNHENAYAFVYRDVSKSPCPVNGAAMKRKSEGFQSESKRHKGIGIGAPDGPISLDDVRSLQRSNSELRQQLETHADTIETLRSENRALVARHENELKDMKEKVSSSYLDQIKDLRLTLDAKQKVIDETNSSFTEARRLIDDLNERLALSNQSRADADDIIQSQKVTISELEAQLVDERNIRKDEREKAETNLKAALQRAHLEAQEEIKRQADVHLRQHQEQEDVISKLQESEKEYRALVETLRSKLDDARESLVASEKKVRQLEVQLQQEQAAFTSSIKRSETLEAEVRRLTNELESEKVAREEAWAKVSALELEISSAIHDLSLEKQRLQGARERIILRETQLRAFYSTTEETQSLINKQQEQLKEQLKAMQKTLEDEENYASTLLGPPSVSEAHLKLRDSLKSKEEPHHNTQEASGTSTPPKAHDDPETSEEEGSATEKQEDVADDGYTQDVDPAEVMVGEDTLKVDEDADPTGGLRTGDLLASEAPGSWAVETEPSGIVGENEGDAADALLMFSEGSPNVVCSVGSRMTEEHKALNAMIGIVAPEFKKKFLDDDDDDDGGETQADDDDGVADVDDTDDGGGGGNDDGNNDDDDDDAMIEDSVG